MLKAKLFLCLTVVLSLLVSCGRVPQAVQEASQDPVTFNLQTANTTAPAGNFVDIPVKLSIPSGESVYGMEVSFTYNATVLEPISASASNQLVHLAASEGQGYIAVLNAEPGQSIDVMVTAKVLNETASSINFSADLITDDGTKLEDARSGVTAKGADEAVNDRLSAQSVSSSLTASSSYTPGQGGKASIVEAKTLEAQFVQLKQDPILAQAFQPTGELSTQAVTTFPEAKREWLESELGDLNQNAVVNLGDSIELLHGLLGRKQLTDYQRFTSDLVDDQKLDEVDLAALIVKVALLKVQKLLKTPSMSLHSSPLMSINNYGKTNEVKELALATGETGLLLIGNAGNSTLKVTVSNVPAWLSVTPLQTTKKYTTLGYELKLLSNAPVANTQGSEAELTFTETSIRPYQVRKIKVKIVPALTASFTTTPTVGQAALKVDVDATNAHTLATDTYAWEFADTNATQANPNTATGIQAAHTYSQAGQYKIKLTVQRGTKTAVTEKTVYVLPTQTELPAPWGRVTTSTVANATNPGAPTITNDGISSSAYDDTAKVFSLSAYSPDAQTSVNHFVYQPLPADGSIVAKVQLAASSSSTAKAGVMLRQSNEATSPFVFAYVSNGKIAVEYLDVATNQVVIVEGGVLSTATEARFLKIERKEGSVYVYESGDNLTWRQIAVVTLALTGSVNVGLVADTTNGLAQVQFDSVLVQAQNLPQTDTTEVALVGPKGDASLIDMGNGYSVIIIDENALKNDVEVKHTVSLKPAASYPTDTAFKSVYDSSQVTVISPQTILEAPLSGFNLNKQAQSSLISILPYFDESSIDSSLPLTAEVRITLADGSEYFYPDYFAPGEPIEIRNTTLETAFNGNYPETLKISVQVVTLNDQNKGRGSLDNSKTFSTLNANIGTLAAPNPTYEEGLYKLELDGITPSSFNTYCPEPLAFTEVRQSMPTTAITGEARVTEGKTPLVLIHGWNALGNLVGTYFNDVALSYSNFAPAFCYWQPSILNFLQENNQSAGTSILRQEYELFSYAYDSEKSVAWNGTDPNNKNNLADTLARAFPDKDVVIVAHSMGGLVTNTVVQQKAIAREPDHIKYVITGGTPYMGSTVMLCRDTENGRCSDSRLNFKVIEEVFNAGNIKGLLGILSPAIRTALYKISRYEGSADLSWQYGGFKLTKDLNSCKDLPEEDARECFIRENKFEGKASVDNPFLTTLNQTKVFNKHTVFYGNALTDVQVETGETLLAAFLSLATGYASDSVTPLDSGCMTALGITPQGCSNSPFKNLILRSSFSHTQMHGVRNLSAITTELLRIANRHLDIDDGTLDGNQRTEIGSRKADTNSTCQDALPILDGEFFGDGVCDASQNSTELLKGTDVDFGNKRPEKQDDDRWRRYGEDADANEHFGDGNGSGDQYVPNLDMSDFRRWRDQFVRSSIGSTNSKKDINDNGGFASCDWENPLLYSFPCWADFNGDGLISRDARIPVPGLTNSSVPNNLRVNNTPNLTDLEVLFYTAKKDTSWSDEYYELTEGGFTDNIETGDIEIWPRNCMQLSGIEKITSNVVGAGTSGNERVLTGNGRTRDISSTIYMVKPGTNIAFVKVTFTDPKRDPILVQKQFDVRVGEDIFWDPACASIEPSVNGTVLNEQTNGSSVGKSNLSCDPLEGVIKVEVEGYDVQSVEVSIPKLGIIGAFATGDEPLYIYLSDKHKLEPDTYTIYTTVMMNNLEKIYENRSFTIEPKECPQACIPVNPGGGSSSASTGSASTGGTTSSGFTTASFQAANSTSRPSSSTSNGACLDPGQGASFVNGEEYTGTTIEAGHVEEVITCTGRQITGVDVNLYAYYSPPKNLITSFPGIEFFGLDSSSQTSTETPGLWSVRATMSDVTEGTHTVDVDPKFIVDRTMENAIDALSMTFEVKADPNPERQDQNCNQGVPDIDLGGGPYGGGTEINLTAEVVKTATGSATVHNAGTANLSYNATAQAAWFSIISGASATVSPDGDETLTVSATCQTAGTFGPKDIVIASNDPDEPRVTIPVTLECTEEPKVPDINVSPTSISLEAEVGSSDQSSFSISNTGEAPLAYMIASGAQAPISIEAASGTLQPSGSSSVSVTGICTEEGTFTGTATVGSNDPDEKNVSVSVTLTCKEEKKEPDINVSGSISLSAEVGETTSGSFSVGNTGNANLTYTVQSPGSPFSLGAGASSTVTPGDSRSVTVSATCQEVGTFTSIAFVGSNDPDENPVPVSVTLSCTEPELTLTIGLNGVTLTSQKIITCTDTIFKPASAVGSATASPGDKVASIMLSGALSGSSAGSSVTSSSTKFNAGSYTYTATATSKGGKTYTKSTTFRVVERVTDTRGKCGSTNNDPRLITFDRLSYDFQSVGEFILAESEDGSVVVQTRQSPVNSVASVNTAFAAKVGAQRIALYHNESVPLWVNGKPVAVADNDYLEFADEASVHRKGNKYVILWPPLADGKRFALDLALFPNNRFNILGMVIPDAYTGKVRGILGNANGNKADDIATRDGQVFTQPVSFDDLYGSYADSWRITQEESLFDYANGDTTETFTDRSYPSRPFNSGDLAANVRAAAEAACRAAGVVDPILLEGCIVDTGLTNDETIAQAAADITPPQAALTVTEPVFQDRTLVFTGKVVNALQTSQGLRTVQVTIDAPGHIVRDACVTNTDAQGNFSCKTTLVDGDAFTARVSVRGYGPMLEQNIDLTSDKIPGIGQTRAETLATFQLNPATLKLTGVVRGTDGKVAANAVISANVSLPEPLGTSTNAEGYYELYIPVAETELTGNVTYTVRYSQTLASDTLNLTVPYTATKGAVADVVKDITLTIPAKPDLAYFGLAGKVDNLSAPGKGLSGLVLTMRGVGASAALGDLCSVNITELGSYQCAAKYIAYQPTLELEYSLRYQNWFTLGTFQKTFNLRQATNLAEILNNDLSIAPRVLELTLDVKDQSSSSVSGALVEIQGLTSLNKRTSTTGHANLDVLLPTDYVYNPADFSYRVSFSNRTQRHTGEWQVLPALVETNNVLRGTTVYTLPLTLEKRRVNFSGDVAPLWRQTLKLDNYTLRVLGADNSELCTTTVPVGTTSYLCPVTLTDDEAIPVKLELSGQWGTVTIDKTVPANAFDTTSTVTQPFFVSVPGVKLTGKVVDDKATALKDVIVNVGGSSARSKADGTYELYVAYALGTTEAQLEGKVAYQSLEQTFSSTIALSNSLVNATQDVIFTKRQVVLSGRLEGNLAPIALINSSLELRLQDAVVCTVTTNINGDFVCPGLALNTSEALALTYAALGNWGSDTGTLTLDAAVIPAVGSSNAVTIKPTAKATLLKLKGLISDDLGNGIQNAIVQLSGPEPMTFNADNTGHYERVFMLAREVTTVSVDVTVRYGSASLVQTKHYDIPVTINILNEAETNIAFSQRALSLSGQTVNSRSGETLANTAIQITEAGQIVCQIASDATGNFSCPQRLYDAAGSAEFRYTLSGDWGQSGEQVLNVTLPSTGASGGAGVTLSVPLTTLVISGTVFNEDNQPLSGANVSVKNRSGVQQTDAAGRYRIPLYFTQGETTATLELVVEKNQAIETIPLSIALTSATVETTQDVVLTTLRQFVLTWGANPRDLDSHIWLPKIQSSHVFYGNSGSKTSFPFTTLDIDATSGYGPETMTLHKRAYAGTYYYAVYNYSNSTPFSASGAKLEVRSKGGTVLNVTAPTQGSGRWWYVLALDGTTGEINVVNQYLDYFDPYAVAGNGQLRIVRVEGVVQGAGTSSSLLADNAVVIRGDSGDLCSVMTNAQGNYSCTFITADNNAFDVEVVVTGASGTTYSPTTVSAGNESVTVTQNVTVTTSTLVLQGQVTGNDSVPLANATVEVFGDLSGSAVTDSNGQYRLEKLVAADRTNVNVTVRASNSVTSQERSLNVKITSAAVTEQREDFSLIVTMLNLRGVVTNGSGIPIANADVNVGGDVYDYASTSADGSYAFSFSFSATVSEVALTLTASDGVNQQFQTLTLPLVSGVVNDVVQNFSIINDVPGTAKWSLTTGTVRTQAMATDGTVYVSSGEAVWAIDRDGTQQWIQTFDDAYVNALSVDKDGFIYVATEWSFHKLNTDGSEVWNVTLGGSAKAIAVTATDVYVAADKLYALNSDGTQAWNYATGNNLLNVAVASDGTVFTSDYSQTYALGAQGNLLWSVLGQATAFALTDSTVYVGSKQQGSCGYGGCSYYLYLNAYTLDGSKRWEKYIGANALAVGQDGTLYAGVYNGVTALNEAGQEVWSASLGNSVMNLALSDDGLLYAGTYQTLHALSLSGVKQWSFGASYGANQKLSLLNNLLYLGANKLYGINVTSTGLANSLWPATYRNNQSDSALPSDNLERRKINISGRVTHPYYPDFGLGGYSVEASSDGKVICRTETDSEGRYLCKGRITNLESVEAVVTTRAYDDVYRNNVTLTVPAGAANGTTELTRDLPPLITTVSISGVLTNAQGQPLPNLTVNASFLESPCIDGYCDYVNDATTDEQGWYGFAIDLPADATNLELYFFIYDGLEFKRVISIPVLPGVLQEHTENFTLSKATLKLSGTVRDSLGQGVRDSYVYVSGAFNEGVYTDVNGQYSFGQTVSAQEPTITFTVQVGGVERTVTLQVEPNSILEHQEDFTLQP
jgi:protocatechuate 3,4-dioxygenase beta subunit/pimeloyl-ACP methyl ester carboxylesterase